MKVQRVLPKLMIVISALLISCSEGDMPESHSGLIKHPTPGNFLHADLVDNKVNFQDKNFDNHSISLDTIHSIGINSGDRNYMFGRIFSVFIINQGKMAVLDEQHPSIRVYDFQSGSYLNSFSSAGRGPGEIMAASDLAGYGSFIAISDRMQKVEVFELQSDVAELSKTIPVSFTPHKLCLSGDDLFVTGVDYTTFDTVHHYSVKSGDPIGSFHQAYLSESALPRIMLSQNRIACNDKTDNIVLVSPYQPYLYGYSKDGELLWVTEIEDFTPVKVTEVDDGVSRPRVEKSMNLNGITDIFTTLISSADSKYVYLQMNRILRKEGEVEHGNILTFRIDSETGESEFISNDIPFIKYENSEFLVTNKNNPYPQIEIHKNPIR